MFYGYSPMNFYIYSAVQYLMAKIFSKFKVIACLVVCVAVCVAAFCMAFTGKEDTQAEADGVVIKIWQIDSFEGGKGSRADFLQKTGDAYTKLSGNYINVISLSADAARLNVAEGILPDLISYGAGMYGIENLITGYASWCHGGYCFLTLDPAADFTDITWENTVINEGKDNLVGAAALFYGLQNATFTKSTGAYVSLINGEYKYLLGTQRDIFRLKTRGVSFTVKPIAVFNDLYQNISVVSGSDRAEAASRFVDYLLTRADDASSIGMLSARTGIYDDEMRAMEGIKYDYTLISPVSEATRAKLLSAVSDGDINTLKYLLK